MKALMIVLVVSALVAALAYFLMGAGMLQPGELQPDDAPKGISFIIGTCYVVGGLLILLAKRWVWITGAVLNALVIAIFVMFYVDIPSVLFSIPGLMTKSAQILIEIGLLYLLVKYRRVTAGAPIIH